MPNKYNVRAKRLALDNLVRARAWSSFRESFAAEDTSLRKAIVECRHHQTTHRTLLHSLCDVPSDSSPPPEVIQLVASAYPRALTLHEPGNGRTPLHLCMHQRSSLSLQTIEALMGAADSEETLTRADLLCAVDGQKQTPLLVAARGEAPDNAIRYLVNEDDGGTSLLLTGRRKKNREQSGVPLKFVASNELLFVGDGLENLEDLLRFMLVRTYRARLKQKFPSLHQNPGGSLDMDTCLLQAIIFCYELIGSSKLASKIAATIIRSDLFHRDRLNTRRDDSGNLTLHIACLSDTHNFDQILRLGDRETEFGINSEDCTLMEYVVNASMNASNAPGPFLSRNHEGEIPLHCAIRTGKHWSQLQLLIDACPSSLECRTSKGELPLHLAMKCGSPAITITNLWTCHPDAATLADGSTGLYPFQLASIWIYRPKNRRMKRKQKKKAATAEEDIEWDATSLSFFLLQQCPAVLTPFLRTE